MIERKKIVKTPREHFMQAAADELARFVRKEIAFQKADRDERAMKLRLPISVGNRETGHNRAREQGGYIEMSSRVPAGRSKRIRV